MKFRYVLTVTLHDVDEPAAIRRLRWLLKALWRRGRVRVKSIRELREDEKR